MKDAVEPVSAGDGPHFCMLVHHTDAVREWAYDCESHIGKLDKALDEAESKGWTGRRHEGELEADFPVQVTGLRFVGEGDFS